MIPEITDFFLYLSIHHAPPVVIPTDGTLLDQQFFMDGYR